MLKKKKKKKEKKVAGGLNSLSTHGMPMLRRQPNPIQLARLAIQQVAGGKSQAGEAEKKRAAKSEQFHGAEESFRRLSIKSHFLLTEQEKGREGQKGSSVGISEERAPTATCPLRRLNCVQGLLCSLRR